MANSTVTSNSETPASQPKYDPIQMLRDYMKDTKDAAPPHFGNFVINRLGDQITWYDRKSSYFKKKWEGSRKLVIILSAAIPFLVGLIDMKLGIKFIPDETFNIIIKLVVGTAGVVIAALEGFNSLYKSQEHYVDYRMTCEQLRQTFSYFMARSGAYAGLSDEAAYVQLVAQAEGIMASENNKWAEVTRQNDKATKAEDIQSAVQEYLKKYGVQPAAPSGNQPPAQPATPPTTPTATPTNTPPTTATTPPITTPPAPVPQPEQPAATPTPPAAEQTPAAPVIEPLPEEEGIDPSDRNPEGN